MFSLLRSASIALLAFLFALTFTVSTAYPSADYARMIRAEKPFEGLYDNTFYRGYGSADGPVYSRFGPNQW